MDEWKMLPTAAAIPELQSVTVLIGNHAPVNG